VGRFAPSPTGQLHLGTLAAAVASYLHARQSNGEWLVRIEDIDPPREIPGSAASILHTLEAMELGWDREVRYQSQYIPKYLATADSLFPALEPSHALAYALEVVPTMSKHQVVVVNLCGRGDKDLELVEGLL
jgi:hypothetical protein